jgi:hypothetical protein
VEASGLLKKMYQLETGVLIVIWSTIMERFNKVNNMLQAVQIDLTVVNELFSSLSIFVQEVRSNFDHFEKEAMTLVGTDKYSADQKRKRARKRQHDELPSTEVTDFTGREKMISEVNVIMDRLLAELERRRQAYALLLSRFGFLVRLPEMDSAAITLHAQELLKIYPNDADNYFSSECLHFKSFVPTSIEIGFGETRKPNHLDLLLVIRSKKLESTFPNIDVILRMFLSAAATNCSGERSFSTLKRVKSCLRSSSGQKRLSAIAVLQIENVLLKEINVEGVIDQFADLKSRRKISK